MSTGRLAGRVAVLTGGTSGIGRVAVDAFEAEGARVACIADRDLPSDRSAGPSTSPATRLYIDADVADPHAVEAAIEQVVDNWGRIDVLYGNAGGHQGGDALDTSPADWERTLAVNLSGQFYLTKFGMPHLLRQSRGSIILTASELALVGARRSVAYCAAKAGVIGLARALATDFSPRGVRVNCLAPGPTMTPAMAEWIHMDGNTEAKRREDRQASATLMNRMADPSEIVKAALFLASDESSFMTGAVQVVDGGVTSWDHV